MNYKTYIPSSTLSKYVKCYWLLEETKNNPVKNKIFPDGCIELIFYFGDLFRKYNYDGSSNVQPRSFIHGQLKKFIEVESTGKIGIFSARFYPHGLQPFIKFDVNEITNRVVCLNDLWGKEGEVLEDKILNTCSNENRILLLEIFLLKKLRFYKEKDKFVDFSANAIIQCKGNISVSELANTVHTGVRNLERKFISSVGISPKLFSRIVRFQNILKLIEYNPLINLTQIAYKTGFYDQAHFIRDFKEFTGLNPKKYFTEDLTLVKFFSFK